jgi:hypothetical protein
MKRVVLSSGLQEAEIRPAAVLHKFKELSESEARERFGDPATLVEVACPACGAPEKLPAFIKNTFTFQQCAGCASVYVSPRPTVAALADYYTNSRAVEYRSQHFDPETAKARRYHLLVSLIGWLGQLVDEAGFREPRADAPLRRAFADIGANNPLIFEEVSRLGLFDRLYAIGAAPLLQEECRSRGAELVDSLAAAELSLGAITACEQLEHQHSPLNFLSSAAERLVEGGVLVCTTRTISGFDLQTLWDKASYIFVPEHLNLLSIEGLEQLVKRAGLELVELSTPGQLDVELVRHAMAENPALHLPPFIHQLLTRRGRAAHEDFQEFLQKHRLSSHVRIAAGKPKGA